MKKFRSLLHVAAVATMGQVLYQVMHGPVTFGNVVVPSAIVAASASLHFLMGDTPDEASTSDPK